MKLRIHIQRRAIFLLLFVILCVTTLSAENPAHAQAHPNPVLLVHGFQDDAKKMQSMAHALQREGWTVLTPTLSPSGGQVGNEILAHSFPISSRQMCHMVRSAIWLALAWVALFAATICNGSVASRAWIALLQFPRRSMGRGGRAFVLHSCCCDGLVWLNYALTADSCAISIVTLGCSIEFTLPRCGRRSI